MGSGSYGAAFAKRFGLEEAPAFVASVLKKSEVAVTYMRQEQPTFDFSVPQPVEDAYLVSMGFLDFPGYSLWEAGKPVRSESVQAPQVTIYDLRAEPYIYINNPLVGLHFNIPLTAFDALADNSGVPRIGELGYPHGRGIDDPTIYHLGMSLMPAFERPEQVNRLFVDHVTLAVSAHVAQAYGGMRDDAPARSGLAPWQQRVALELIEQHLAGDISHATIAQMCGISPSHFARAFRRSLRMPPHQWLLRRRVDKAKALLRETGTPLAEVAARCGFADQSHFTRVFRRIAGLPPGEWRRRTRS